MALPVNWPPPMMSGRFSLRFYATGTATAAFADNAFIFKNGTGVSAILPLPDVDPGESPAVFALPPPTHVVPTAPAGTITPLTTEGYLYASTIRICNDGGGVLAYSFDGTNVHGTLKANEIVVYRNRHEAGIAFNGASAVFRVEAW